MFDVRLFQKLRRTHPDDGKRQIAEMGGGLWAVCVGFHLQLSLSLSLIEMLMFGSVIIVIFVISIVYGLSLQLLYRNFSSFDIQP